MKITDIRILGRGITPFVLIEIHTDEGIVGIGGCESYGPAVRAILETGPRALKPLLIGQDPRDVARLWNLMYQHWVAQHGPYTNAMGAIDLALWDIKGKAAGQPVYKLLGGAVQDRIMAYASSTAYLVTPHIPGVPHIRQESKDIIAQMRGYARAGYKAIKIGWGNCFTPADQETLAGIREAIGPETRLMLDFGTPAYWGPRWTPGEAIKVARICEKYGVFFLEEPMPPFDVEGHKALADAVDIYIASGEMLCAVHEFEPYLSRRAVDIIQPDAYRIGLSQMLEVTRRAERCGVFCVPHSPWSALAIAAHVNVLCTASNGLMVESPGSGLYVDEGPVWGPMTRINFSEVVEHPPVIKDGYAELPTRPGLGVGGFVYDAIAKLEEIERKGGEK